MKIRHRKVTNSKYFQGEMMVCYKCGKMQRSNPIWESGWTVIEIDGIASYICPQCFGAFSTGVEQSLTMPSPTSKDRHED